MGIEVAALLISAAGVVGSISAQQNAKKESKRAAEDQRKIQSENRATAAQQRAQEQRTQVREERVRRARILQSAENGGVDGSSGEIGAVGALSTNLGNNLGINLGRAASADRSSIFAQSAADHTFEANKSMQEANMWGQASSIGKNIFMGQMGAGTGQSTPFSLADPIGDLLRSNRGSGD